MEAKKSCQKSVIIHSMSTQMYVKCMYTEFKKKHKHAL